MSMIVEAQQVHVERFALRDVVGEQAGGKAIEVQRCSSLSGRGLPFVPIAWVSEAEDSLGATVARGKGAERVAS